MPTRSNPTPHKVGDKIQVSLSGGKIVTATIKSIIERTDGLHYHVAFEPDQPALVRASQIVEK